MRFVFFVIVVLFASPVAHAAPCKAGEVVTLEGEIIIPPVIDGGEWFWSGKFANKPCQVTTLRGKGALPPDCVFGKRLTLRGRVVEDGILAMQVSSISCY
jgi:hypothetical protein